MSLVLVLDHDIGIGIGSIVSWYWHWHLGGCGEGRRGGTRCCGDEVGLEAYDGCHLSVSAVDAVGGGVHDTVHRELVN